MDRIVSAAEIEERARLRGLSMMQVTRRAGIAHSTWTRWRAAKSRPTLAVYERILAALDSDAPAPTSPEGR